MSEQTRKTIKEIKTDREHHKDHMAGSVADKQPCDQTRARQNKTVEKGGKHVSA